MVLFVFRVFLDCNLGKLDNFGFGTFRSEQTVKFVGAISHSVVVHGKRQAPGALVVWRTKYETNALRCR